MRSRSPRPMSWNVFVARTRLDVDGWLAAHGIKTHAALSAACIGMNVVPPSEEEWRAMRPRAASKKDVPAPVRDEVPAVKPKRQSKRGTDDGDVAAEPDEQV